MSSLLFTPPQLRRSSSSTSQDDTNSNNGTGPSPSTSSVGSNASATISEKSRGAAAKASEAWQRGVGGFGGLMSSSGISSGLSTGLGTGLGFGSVLNRAVEKDKDKEPPAVPATGKRQSNKKLSKTRSASTIAAGSDNVSVGEVPSDAAGISKENLLHLSMKLSTRLKTLEANYDKLKQAYKIKRTQSDALGEVVAVLSSQTPRLGYLSNQLMSPSSGPTAVSLPATEGGDGEDDQEIEEITWDLFVEELRTSLSNQPRANVPFVVPTPGDSVVTFGNGTAFANADDDDDDDVETTSMDNEGVPTVVDHNSNSHSVSNSSEENDTQDNSKIIKVQDKNRRLEQQIQQMSEQIKDAQTHAQTANMQVISLRQLMNTSKAEAQVLQDDADIQRRRGDALEEQVVFLKLQTDSLKKETAQAKDEEYEALVEREEELKGRVFELEEQAMNARQERTQVSLQLEEVLEQREASIFEGAELRANAVQLEALAASLKRELSSLKKRGHSDGELISELTDELSHANQRAVESSTRAEELDAQLVLLKGNQEKSHAELVLNYKSQIEVLHSSAAEAREKHRDVMETLEGRVLELERAVELNQEKHAKVMRQAREDERKRAKHAKQVVEEQGIEIETLKRRQVELEEDVHTGKPGERMLMEMAKAQSSREGVIHGLESEVLVLRDSVKSLQEHLTKSQAEEAHLHDSLAKIDTEQRRNGVNVEYLKNILVRFMAFDLQSSERRTLTRAIATMLEFSPEEIKVTGPPATGAWWRRIAP